MHHYEDWIFRQLKKTIKSIDYKEAKRLAQETCARSVFFYASGSFLEKSIAFQIDMVNLLIEYFSERGFDCIFVSKSTDIVPNGAAHIWMQDTPPANNEHPFLYHALPSYLHGFWYWNKTGVRNLSSLKNRFFQPDKLNTEKSLEIFERLYKRYVEADITKWPQMKAGSTSIPLDCICVAAQGDWTAVDYPRYVDFPQLAKAAIQARGGKSVWIKPHPKIDLRTSLELAKLHDPSAGIYYEDCNLHELLSKCSLVITRCSAVALEAMLHKKPAIVAAQVDFHHGVETICSENELPAAIERIEARDFSYEKYLFWFFKRLHIEPAHKGQTLRKIEKSFASLSL